MATQPDVQDEDASRSPLIVQTLHGGISLGAHNAIRRIGDLVAGDKVAGDKVQGDKIAIGTLQIVVYTGPSRPIDPAARFSLEQAYRSEIVARYAVWRERYAPLPMQTLARPNQSEEAPGFLEHEDLILSALGTSFAIEAAPPVEVADQAVASGLLHTFTDLREALDRYQDIILLGPPGGGKTTALWRLALDLAQNGLAADGNPDTPIPVFVRLGGIAGSTSLLSLLQRELATAVIYDRRRQPIRLLAHQQLAPLVPELLQSGRTVLLWDGLNETPREQFVSTAQAIRQFPDRYPATIVTHNTSVTTCRAEDFAALVELNGGQSPLPFQQVTIQGLDPESIRTLAIGRLGKDLGQKLLIDLEQPQHRVLLSLARTPLLLTMLCEVYAAQRALPKNRGKLLAAFVHTRWRWERARQRDRWIGLATQQKMLAWLAYDITASHGRGTSVPWEWVQQVLKRIDYSIEPLQVCQLAQAADIVEFADEGRALRFTHQLLQEYFAAVALESKLGFLRWPHIRETYRWQNQRSHWQQRIRGYIAEGTRTGWEETLFMLAGLRENAAYLQELTGQFLSRPLEAAQIVSSGDVDEALRGEVIGAALKQLEDRTLRVQQRVEAGAALAIVGDPRSGVCRLAPDWCDVQAGPFLLGSTDQDEQAYSDEKPQRTVELPGFRIARYPVTNAQWRAFVEAGGYGERRWWSAASWQAKETEGWTQPRLWEDPRFNGSNQPIIGVSWYEAVAFCRWLSSALGYEVRLPSEAEWEKAARGTDGRSYPWGDAWDAAKANTRESGIGVTTPVGCFSDGASPYGVLDMSGNVWEWTVTPWTDGYQQSDGTARKTEGGDQFVSRGGAWSFDRRDARCASRYINAPVNRGNVLGVRVVAALTPDG